MSELSIQEITNFINTHPELKKVPKSEVLAIMNLNIKQEKDGLENFGLELKHENVKQPTLLSAELTRENAQDLAIESIGSSISTAQETFKTEYLTQGDVSRTYDMCKELLKTDLSVSKVDKVISLENLGYTYLNEARGSKLTKKDYYEHVKEDLFLMTPNLSNLSDKGKENLKKRIDSLSIEEVKFFEKKILDLPAKDSNNYEKEVQNYFNNFTNLTQQPQKIAVTNSEIPSIQNNSSPEIRQKIEYLDGDELIKFEEVFEYERGTSFDKQKIAKYDNAKNMLYLAHSSSEKVKKIHSRLDKPLANSRGDWQASDLAEVDLGLKLTLNDLFGKDETAQQAGLQKLLGENNYTDNISLSKALLKKLDENLEKIMNGKNIDDYNEDYAKAYVDAFGKKNAEELAKAYKADNESISDKATGMAQMGGMGMMVTGGVMCLIPTGITQAGGTFLIGTGSKFALGGMIAQTALKFENESSKSGGMTDEAKDELIKEGLINLSSFIMGAGAGIKGASVSTKMLAGGSSKWTALAAERGIDTTLSLAGDLILTGNLNIEANSIGQLTAMLTGAKTGKSINKSIASKSSNFKDFNIPEKINGHLKNKNIDANNTIPEIRRTLEPDKIKPAKSLGTADNKSLLIRQNKNGKLNLTQEGEKQVKEIAEKMHKQALKEEAAIIKIMEDLNLGKAGVNMTHRPKSAQSIYDKIKNDMLNSKAPAKFEKAAAGVKDAVGTRTEMKDFNYKDYPEIVEMMKTNPEKGILMAAEKQSEPYFQMIKGIIKAQAEGNSDISAVRITNYKGNDGISYLSDRQVAVLRDEAAKYGIDLNIKDKLTKIRPSGYTALQMNFVTKNNFTYEWQLRGSKVNKFAELEHVPYDIRERKDITGGNHDLDELYKPIEKIIHGFSDTEMDDYNGYLTKHFKYLRETELGFETEAPALPEKFDIRLSADNLEHLHSVADLIKKKKITKEEGLNSYNKLINESPDKTVRKQLQFDESQIIKKTG